MERTSQPGWKRALKCGISLLVFLFSETRKTLARALGQTPESQCVVLYYHSVPAWQRLRCALQLDVVLRRARPIRVYEDIAQASGKNCVVVTFDDGFENFLTQEQILRADHYNVSRWDSVASVTLFATIEEEFGVEVDLQDLARMVSFETILGYLTSNTTA